MMPQEFQERLRALERAFAGSRENPGSYECAACGRSISCMFCSDCEGCYRCTHCASCRVSMHCTHCTQCEDCSHCAYCVESRRCSGSAFLHFCTECHDCTYCFGCAGLQRRDFHILNEPYTREEYFERVSKLKRALGTM